MPKGDVDDLQATESGFLDKALLQRTGWINDRLRKRYAIPFAAPVNETVLGWLTDLVTVDAYDKRGRNPSAEQDARIDTRATEAKAEIKEAADSKEGLFDLPLKQNDVDATGIVKGEPIGDAEASPYAWADAQAEALQ